MSSAGAFHRFEDFPRLSQRWILPPLIPEDCGREEIQSTPYRTPPYIRRQTFAPGNKPYSSSCPSEESCCCPLPQSTNQNLPAVIPPRPPRQNYASRPCVSPGPDEPPTSHIYFRRLQSCFSFPDTSCSRLGSAAAGYENALPHFEHEIQFRPADTCRRVCAHRNRPRCRNQDDKARVSALRSRVAAERTGRLDRCGTTSEVANCRRLPAAPIAPEHPSPVALGRYPERASKSASSLQPLSQTNLRDLPLLLRSFLKFGVIVIFQSAPQNLQNLRR